MIEFLKTPFVLFIITIIIFTVSIVGYRYIKNKFLKYIVLLIGIANFPLIPSAFTIQYISEYGRNIPDVDEATIEKCLITNLTFKQDDDGEYHYAISDKYGGGHGTDIDNHIDIEIEFINGKNSYSEYEFKTKTDRDWATLDRVLHTYKLTKLYISNEYKIEIFND